MTLSAMKARFRANIDRPFLSVHRGLWGPLPENSVPAIRAASAWDIVEIDVQLDETGIPFLMHDKTLTRTTGREVLADRVPTKLREMARLRSGAGGPDASLTHEVIPTLDQAFEALGTSDAIFDLDVKHAKDVDAIAAYVARIGRAHHATLKMRVSTPEDIARLRAVEDRYGIMAPAKFRLTGPDDLSLLAQMRQADIAAVEIWFNDIDLLKTAIWQTGHTMRFGAFTLRGSHSPGFDDKTALENPKTVWGALYDAGIGLFMTDHPEDASLFFHGSPRLTVPARA